MNGREILERWRNRTASLIEVPVVSRGIGMENNFNGRDHLFIHSLWPAAQRHFEQFFEEPEAKKIINLIASFSPVSAEDELLFCKSVVGRIFEEVAKSYVQDWYTQFLRSRYKDPTLGGIKIISSETIESLYSTIRGVNTDDRNFYGVSISRKGITLPDYLILREKRDYWLVEAVAECKTSKQNTREIDRQLKCYPSPATIANYFGIYINGQGNELGPILLGKLINKQETRIPYRPVRFNSALDYLFVVPKKSALNCPERFRPVEVPFNSTEFAIFVNSMSRGCFINTGT